MQVHYMGNVVRQEQLLHAQRKRFPPTHVPDVCQHVHDVQMQQVDVSHRMSIAPPCTFVTRPS